MQARWAARLSMKLASRSLTGLAGLADADVVFRASHVR